MKTAILQNNRNAGLRRAGKRAITAAWQVMLEGELKHVVLPEYNSFAELLDDDPVVIGTSDETQWSALATVQLLIWEWGWTSTPATKMLEIRRRLNLPTLMFPGPLDRFWRELSPKDAAIQMEALEATDAIGVMLADTVPFYRSLAPHAHVFHLPVPVDVESFRAARLPGVERDPNLWLLTAPTRFTGPGSQLPISTYVAFRSLVKARPAMRGICFAYDDAERDEAEHMLALLGLSRQVEVLSYMRPIQRYLSTVARCTAGLTLPNGMIQGRNALTSACLEIPMVVSAEVETHRRLFPLTSIPWYATDEAVARCIRICDDPDFRDEVTKRAAESVRDYAVSECRARLRDGAEIAAQRHRASGTI